MDLAKKSTIEQIHERSDNDVERFSRLEMGQQALPAQPHVAHNHDAKRGNQAIARFRTSSRIEISEFTCSELNTPSTPCEWKFV